MTSSRGGRTAVAVLAAVAPLLVAAVAQAGGLYVPARGVRPAGRGGAFVAGADDLGALWYNPAGLGALIGGRHALVDFAIVGHEVTYTRTDSGGYEREPVTNSWQPMPVPTLAAAYTLDSRTVIGGGLLAPYSGLDGYPEAGPQRYSLVSLHGTALVIGELAATYQVSPRLTVGAGLQNMFVSFRSRVALTGCPGQVVCAPEDPEYDAVAENAVVDLFNPSGILGARLELDRRLRLGAAVQLPFWIHGEGTTRVRLPAAGFFDGSSVHGDRAALSLTLPAIVRVGAEAKLGRRLRVEAGVDWEMWSMHDEILIEPRDIRIEDAAGVGVYDVGPLRIPRHFRDTIAVRLGGEGAIGRSLSARGGYVFETGAAPDEYLTVMTVDAPKHLLSAGASIQRGRTRVDAVAGVVLVADREVPFGTSCAPQLNAIRSGQTPPAPPAGEACVHDGDPDRVYVGDGTYESIWFFGGLGMAVAF